MKPTLTLNGEKLGQTFVSSNEEEQMVLLKSRARGSRICHPKLIAYMEEYTKTWYNFPIIKKQSCISKSFITVQKYLES